jgi:glutaredoxin
MQPSPQLLQHSARLTLFSRSNCSLCEVAKATLSKLRERRPFDYQEVDISAKGQEQWKKLYQYDIPVLHVERITHPYAKPNVVSEAKKLMHRFSEKQVESLMDEAKGRT